MDIDTLRRDILEAIKNCDEKCLEQLLTISNGENASCVKCILESDPSVLADLCRLKFFRIIDMLVTSHILDMSKCGVSIFY